MAKLDACVKKVVESGKSESEAYTICRTAAGAEGRPKKWSEELWAIVQPFSKTMSSKFEGVEIARTGSFKAMTGPLTFTTSDFDNAQKAYEALHEKHRAIIKLGHNEEQTLLVSDGMPNAGFVENIRRDGDRLVCDLVDVPDAVASLVEAGRLNSRSVEAIRNIQIAGKRWPFVITGLALLGEDLPAVDSLKDVAALYAERGLDVPETDDDEAQVVVIMSGGGVAEADVDVVIGQLNQLMDKAEAIVYKRGGAPKFRTLVRSAVDELRAISRKQKTMKGSRTMDSKSLATMLGLPEDATDEEIAKKVRSNAHAAAEAAKAAEKAEADKTKADADKEKEKASEGERIGKLETDLAEARKTIVSLQGKDATTTATSSVDAAIKAGKFVPASRATLIELAVSAPEKFEAMAKAVPDGTILARAGESGRDGGGSADDIALSPDEVRIAAASGVSEDELKSQKYRDAGKPVPAEVQKRLDEANAARLQARRRR